MFSGTTGDFAKNRELLEGWCDIDKRAHHCIFKKQFREALDFNEMDRIFSQAGVPTPERHR
ncbi:hypothetical protein D3C87_1848650 [compost metagenome]